MLITPRAAEIHSSLTSLPGANGFGWRRAVALALLASATVAIPAVAGAASAPNNEDLRRSITTLIEVHNVALPFSLLPDPVVGIPASGVTFANNLLLKDTQAIFETPGDWAAFPNAAGGCIYEFELPQSEASYSDLLGLITLNQLPQDWGNLTGLGGPVSVTHANTGVKVHVRNRFVDANKVDSAQTVELPSGIHTFDWEADTQISTAFDIVIPAVLLSYNSVKYLKSVNNLGWSAARHAASQNAAREILKNIAINTGLGTASQFFDTRTSVTHHREQNVTIWKSRGPRVVVDEPVITLEATDFGGVVYARVAAQLQETARASDPCDKPFLFGSDAPLLLPIGTTDITWTATDFGPLPSGDVNRDSAVQRIIVEDTQAPILVPPPSRVIEVPTSGLSASEVMLGNPRVVDLADPAPVIANDGPGFYPVSSRSQIRWTATDASGNQSDADQLITIKAMGTNTAPTVSDVVAQTLTSQPVDIVLSGQDGDFLDGRFDPLSFRISQRPANGEFVAPLYPFFIEDYRTQPGGAYGQDFILSSNKRNWLEVNVCRVVTGPDRDKIALDWVYRPLFVHVTDDGLYAVLDYFFTCDSGRVNQDQRISFWDADGNYLDQVLYRGTNNNFVVDQDGFIYTNRRVGDGSSASLQISQLQAIDPNNPEPGGNSWTVRATSASNPELGLSDPVEAGALSYGRVDTREGVLFVTDRRKVFVFDVLEDLTDGIAEANNNLNERYRGALNNGETFLCTSGAWGSNTTGFVMDVDREGNLYIADSCADRIHKFAPTRRTESGDIVRGEYIGWLGRCETSTNNACDEERQISKGYSCTDDTCSVDPGNWAGTDNGQFSELEYLALDPKGVLYATDAGDPDAGGRVQRFGSDGSFGGVARSTGTGINQGDQPGFVLGNLGTVRAVSVNSTQFFVVDQEESFVHVFETSPLKDITDDSVTVSYVSNFDFHSDTDVFEFIASDGLADSNVGTVSVEVSRNFRAPVAMSQAVATVEGQSVDITLSAEDLDGIEGIDFNGLDVLSYRVVAAPRFGTLTEVTSDNATTTLRYMPDPDASGEDRFAFVASDGVEDSAPAEVVVDVAFVDDPPRIEALAAPSRVGLGFPVVIAGEFFDDGAESFSTSLIIGDGSPIQGRGDIVDEDTQPRIEGVVIFEPSGGAGIGRAVAQHTYTTPGTYEMTWCVRDQLGREGCEALSVEAAPLVSLGIDLPESEEGVEPLPVNAGEGFFIDVTVGNLQPDGVSGLVARSVVMDGTVAGAGVTFTGASQGNCQISDGGRSMRCDFGDFAVGEERIIRVSFASSGALLDDEDADIDLVFTTASDAVNEQTVISTVRSLESVIMIFRDAFETD